MDGATEVQSGRISAGQKGGDGGGDEHPGNCADVWPAPGYGAQNAGLFGPAGLSPTVSAWKAQVEPLHRRHRRILEDDLARPRKQRHTARNASPERCWTGLSTTSTSWRSTARATASGAVGKTSLPMPRTIPTKIRRIAIGRQLSRGDIFAFQLGGQNRWTTTPITPLGEL